MKKLRHNEIKELNKVTKQAGGTARNALHFLNIQTNNFSVMPFNVCKNYCLYNI